MHFLRTTILRLRPLTGAQAAQRLSQPSLSVITAGSRIVQPSRQLNTSEPFLNGTSTNYMEEMYYAWLENPKNVHKVQYASMVIENVSLEKLFWNVQRCNLQPPKLLQSLWELIYVCGTNVWRRAPSQARDQHVPQWTEAEKPCRISCFEHSSVIKERTRPLKSL